MDSIKKIARQAKLRMKNNFWQDCKQNLQQGEEQAKTLGLNERKVKSYLGGKVQSEIKGQTPDEFYLKVKALLDAEGEVSDALGRLTDKAYYDTLSYEEKQRYTMNLSAKYLAALEQYRREKSLSAMK
ncbi:MAG: hypothetical protein LUD27_06955 [Clostridia bacterium]|nr:hypothetical protein [Clostridia bacterium]